jgi:hypothetical protein
MVSKYFTPNVVLTILGVLTIVAIFYRYNTSVEGFAVPSARQTSMIASSVAGATSSNPLTAKPQGKDIQATMESLNNFVLLATSKDPASTNLSKSIQTDANKMKANASSLQNKLQAALANSDAAHFTSKSLSELRKRIDSLTNSLRNAIVVSGPTKPAVLPVAKPAVLPVAKPAARPVAHPLVKPVVKPVVRPVPAAHAISTANPVTGRLPAHLDVKPTTVASPPGIITLDELNNLNRRIQQEILRLSNLRSASPTLTARISQLEKINADLNDIIVAVQRRQLQLKDVPIKPSDAQAFLKQLSNMSASLPSLMSPSGKMNTASMAPPMDVSIASNPDVQSLLQNAQYLKWNVQLNLEFNPELAQKGRLITRLEEMEKRLTSLAVSETPIPNGMYKMYKQEMKTIQSIMNGGGSKQTQPPPIEVRTNNSTRNGLSFNTPDYPSSAQLTTAQGGEMGVSRGQFPNGEPTPDVYIRPGFLMNNETIERRASAASFDPSTVGGPDYKKRSQELCRQVQGAQLGDPQNFGCIKNPSEVSSDYSWKGNYQMVCNRIGDTWGGWYPEMFGCPKYDPTAKFQGSMM